MLIDNSFASKSPNMLLKSPLILTNGLEKITINTDILSTLLAEMFGGSDFWL